MPYQLVITRGRSATQAVKLSDGITTVGRQEGCELRIVSSQVSRKHCQLFEKKGLLLVKDLGSSNGTLVNGKKIEDQRVLQPGDELTIGQVKFRVEKVEAPTPGTKPGDTAIAQPIAVSGSGDVIAEGGADVIALDDTTQPQDADAAPTKAIPTAQPASVQEVSEDAVAAFLLDLDLDDEGKT
ncbi:MAG: FHA domain-containing protein [Isosphaeraceae bacterium]|nr:FHA domain-containing protein [Isosphaeraceae bacterium]